VSTDVVVPKFGLTVTEVEVIEWLSASGGVVVEGDPLVVVTADKADVEITAPATGTLEVLAAVGDPVDVGGLLGRILGEGGGPSEVAEPAAAPDRQGQTAPPAAPAVAAAAPPTAAPVGSARVVASPLARREARELGVDLALVSGSGPGGRVVRADVRRASEAAAQGSTPGRTSEAPASAGASPADDHTVIELSPVRRVTARRMAASARTTAPAVITMACDVSQAVLVQQRAREAGVPATVTHLVMLATARALAGHPGINGYFIDDHVVSSASVNLGLAVDVDGDLMVPVVHDCAVLDLRGLVEATRSAVDRARSGSLTVDDASGGTFTISNLGMFGVESFTPIINAPQIAILGVGTTRDEVLVVDGAPRVRPVLRLSLTFDHRAVDGAPAARFLADVRDRLAGIDSLDLPPRGG
jgi:pyruvate dehydrogenase E2 component (dihydrolipoamide acetyltransferase)